MTTKPFLVIDLEKSWREAQHPRDKFGKFTSVKGGSRVVTSTGKTGVVKNNTGDKVTVTYDGGGSGTLHRNNVLHANDHKKVSDAQAKKKRTKAKKAGKKQSATKAQTKANGTQKAPKLVVDPTKRAPRKTTKTTAPTAVITAPKAKTARKTAPPKAKKEEVLTNYGKAPSVKNKPIPQSTTKDRKVDNKHYEDFKRFDESGSIDGLWASKEVQKLMAKAPEKRPIEEVERIAGHITEQNKKLAFSVANKRADMMGWGVIKNRIGNVNAKNPIYQETGARFELIQSGMGAMYETLYNVLRGKENPTSAIGAHVTSRMKQKITKDLYGMLNTVPAPHAVRRAIGEMKKHENDVTQKLGRTPSDKELADHMMEHSEAFRNSAIIKPARWDDKANTWVATNKEEKDPEKRLKALKRYADQQRTLSTDKVINGGGGEREITLADTMAVQDDQRSPEENYVRQERQVELQGALPKAMKDMGLSDQQINLYALKHSEPSAIRKQPYRTDQEVADIYNKQNGTNFSAKWVYKHVNAGRKLIAEAVASKHPAVQKLMTMKSFVFNMILKSIYEYDLVKSLSSWGLDHTVLDIVHTRTAYAPDIYELRKSLAPTEYIGSYSTVDTGAVRAHIIEYRAPEPTELAKAFHAFSNDLRKSLFPHKGGTNHGLNENAKAYVGKNKGKFKEIHGTQQARLRQKQSGGGKLTWSEELALKENGFWISWGGKRILIHGDEKNFGSVAYDSHNEAHREEHNEGAPLDRIDFHHEGDDLANHHKQLEDKAKTEHTKGSYVANGKRNKKKWAEIHGVKWNEEAEDFHTDDKGNLQFDHAHNEEKHKASLDHGVHAFITQQETLRDRHHGKDQHDKTSIKAIHRINNGHKVSSHYTGMTEDERKAYDMMSDKEKAIATGSHVLEQPGVRERLAQLKKELMNAPKSQHKAIADKAIADFKASQDTHGSKLLVNSNLMRGKSGGLGGVAKELLTTSVDGLRDKLGQGELARSREEVGKNLLPEGKYTIGNPQTGKSFVISIGHSHKGSKVENQFTSNLLEAFDPHTGEHHTFEGTDASWGSLAHMLGYPRGIKFAEVVNKGTDQPMLKEMDDKEFAEARKKTRAGLQDDMLHTGFKKVNEVRNKDGELSNRTFAMKLPDGTENAFDVGKDGFVKDPIFQRLLKQREPIESPEDLHNLLKKAVGNTVWTTLHAGSDIHTGDALGHHVKLMYDGKGAPRVVGGTYDGYRFLDTADVPKGTIDPHTGEPVKALFKNGKLINRRFTTKNNVAMEAGNAVMYPSGDGKFRKGRIQDVQDGSFKVLDAKGNLVGMFSAKELKHAREDGKINSDSGGAVVKLGQRGRHRLDTSEAFRPEGEGARAQARANKAKGLLAEAMKKAKVGRAFDSEGNLKEELELSDAQMGRLKKVLGRSQAGRAMLKQFNSAYTSELELHVPEHLRATLEAEGVTIRKNGIAHISTSKFEQVRDVLATAGSGVSLEQHARTYLNEHFRMKDRTKQSVEQLKKKYQPSALDSGKPVLDDLYRSLFKESSFLRNPNAGLFSTQLEGIGHLVERKRGIAGHGMGTGKTILGVMGAMHYKASQLAQGKKPKKTLIVAPKGIMSDWGKEIAGHTNSKGLIINSNLKGLKAHPDGGGKKMWGQEGSEQEAVRANNFAKNIEKHASEDHDFHIMSYETFAKLRHKLTDSGMYDNIVIDEVHAFKNKGSNRGKSLAETTDKFKNVWGLSGTPMENDAREIYSLVDTVTGGRHELGTKKEFQEKYMLKDRKGKITGIKPGMEDKLGAIVANVVQFRHGRDVQKNDGSKIHFPAMVGTNGGEENPPMDFIGNMADGNRDHQTNEYYGTKHSIMDFEEHEITPDGAEGKTVKAYTPQNLKPAVQAMYNRYSELQQKYLPESKLKELAHASATGYDRGKQDNSNYLTAMQKLQKYINAPLAEKMYVGEGHGNAIEADITDAQGTSKKKKDGLKPYNPETGEGHYNVDSNGHKRYFESDGKGGFVTNADGSPKELPPLHHDNPKAQYMKARLGKYLDSVQAENTRRRANGQPEIMPKVVVKSDFTTFGTDIVDGVLRDLMHPTTGHPELQRWHAKTGGKLNAGRFTGEADDREDTKVGFRGNKKDYANNQGHLWATTVSPAGKEGVDFGNAHYMIHFDQNWNPQKMAQFTARVRRADSHEKAHASVERANAVRVESLHMPGTIEDFMFNAQDSKMKDIHTVEHNTRLEEEIPKYGETTPVTGRGARAFTRGKGREAGRKPKGALEQTMKKPKGTRSGGSTGINDGLAVASADKAFKLVILL